MQRILGIGGPSLVRTIMDVDIDILARLTCCFDFADPSSPVAESFGLCSSSNL